jgi:regulator of protease activity HflC (stomatin/prohibitin superfamily)
MTPFENFIQAFTSPKAFFFYFVSASVWLIIFLLFAVPSSLYFKHFLILGLGLGTALWLYGNGKFIKYFMVSVPEVTGLVTLNLATGEMNAYGSGLHFILPWEQVKDGNYINLRVVKTDIVTETFPSKDGPVMIIKWFLQYASSVELLTAYIAVSEEVINDGLNEVASSFLTMKIRDMEAEDVRDKEKKKALENDLFEHFRQTVTIPVTQPDGSSKDVPLEEYYGISIKLVTIADADFEADYQKARSTDQVMRKYKETADGIKGTDGSITNKDALDSVLMVAGKGVSKTVTQETKVFDVTPALASAVKAVAETFASRKEV